jgi:hypothetical protein
MLVLQPGFFVKAGSGAAACLPLDPASLLGRAPAPLHVLRLQTLSPCWEGSSTVTRPTVPCGPRASNIKKSIAGLPMQLDSRACFQGAWRRAIMSLQDVRSSRVNNAYKTCGHVATVPRRPYWPITGHCYSARRPDKTVPYRGLCATW